MDLRDFSFDGWVLFAGFVFSVIGWWMFKTGRNRENTKITVIGVVLMVYPYFITGRAATILTGAALCFLANHYWYG